MFERIEVVFKSLAVNVAKDTSVMEGASAGACVRSPCNL
ncbi:hypothetical protein EGR_02645 [Echinococcus granulosus]|uniref:Uncharacterized protein n=1 Tax=Echinococcus granulosus TaxID=6210 RepID=W6UN45_ECHGR|nr:hypothetical protein EGR_02645 [Echinococcus granulosus]EUB62513.1 hypothetical protein EGR_02645 [Echinococcus granulosus]